MDIERVYDDMVKENLVRNEARAESDEDLARAEDEAYNDLFGREVEKPRG